LLWLATFGAGFFEGEGLLFFSFAVWMQKTNFNIETPKHHRAFCCRCHKMLELEGDPLKKFQMSLRTDFEP
jgi:hypothetical protein